MGEPGGALVVAVDVRAGVEAAFGVFTAGIGDWWPVAAYSVEPGRLEAVVLEGWAGGRLYERWAGGDEADWGQVLAWEPPARVLLAWSPSPERPAPTAVEVRFTAVDPEHTRVELEHRGWERLGDQGDHVWAGYEEGWPRVLDAFAGAATGAHHRWFARSLNGLVWRLLARPIRPEPALHHARRCPELAGGAPGVADFDHAYAAETMARALACAGDLGQAATWHSRATAAGATVAADDDRRIFTDDLATGPWFGLNRR
jgi:hypothetical protein